MNVIINNKQIFINKYLIQINKKCVYFLKLFDIHYNIVIKIKYIRNQ